MTLDAIGVLAGGIKQNAEGRWVSSDLTAEDDNFGAPGGKLRVLAAAVLANKNPSAVVMASGGMGYDIPKDAPAQRPSLAEIMHEELVEAGVPAQSIVHETNSNNTYQQLQELALLMVKNKWKEVAILTNRWHVPRVQAMIDAKFAGNVLQTNATVVPAEDVLIENDSVRWQAVFDAAYESAFLAERIKKEQDGIAQIKEGTYRFI